MNHNNACYICGENRANSLEQHHIVPRRFGGSDDDENLVQLCASCHAAVEKLYDSRFYNELGVTADNGEQTECELEGCTAIDTRELVDYAGTARICADHADACGASQGPYSGACDAKATHIVRSYYGNRIRLECEDHAVCGESGCNSRQVLYDPDAVFSYRRCLEHFDSSDEAESERRPAEVTNG